MSYDSGKLGVAEGIALVFILTFSRTFLSTPAVILENTAGLAWLTTLLHGLPALVMLFIFLYVFQRFPGDLFSVSRQLVGSVGAWIISLYYLTVFFLNYILILRQFAENTLLNALPFADFNVVIAIYAGVAAFVVYAGVEAMTRATSVLLPFGTLLLLLVLVLLIPFYNIYNLAPWQGTGFSNVFVEVVARAGVDFGVVAFVILAPAFQSLKTIRTAALFGMGLSLLLRSLAVLVYTLVFGVAVGREKVLPFFEMARLVYLSRYVQRIEALFIIIWVIAGALNLAASLYVGLYILTKLLNLPSMRPLIGIVTIVLAELSIMPPDIVTVIGFDGKAIIFFNIGIYVIPLILLVAAIVRSRQKEDQPWAAESQG
jgi:spore germination protein KB